MRYLIVLVMLAVIAPGLAAQHRVDPSLRAAEVQAPGWPAPSAAPTNPEGHANAAPEIRSEAESNSPAATQKAVLDQAFWRSVLAGVIVTVVSTLILRAIL